LLNVVIFLLIFPEKNPRRIEEFHKKREWIIKGHGNISMGLQKTKIRYVGEGPSYIYLTMYTSK
jgi:hypothetical protein